MLLGILLSGKQSNLSTLLCNIMLNDYLNNGDNYRWISTIKTTFNYLGMSNIWISQNFLSAFRTKAIRSVFANMEKHHITIIERKHLSIV